jgi:hypothetical protein
VGENKEPIVKMNTIKKISIKIKKPTPLTISTSSIYAKTIPNNPKGTKYISFSAESIDKVLKTKKGISKYEKPIPNNEMGSTYLPFPKSFIKKLQEKRNKSLGVNND